VGHPVPSSRSDRVSKLQRIEWSIAVHVKDAQTNVAAEQRVDVATTDPVSLTCIGTVLEHDEWPCRAQRSDRSLEGQQLRSLDVDFHEIREPTIGQVIIETLDFHGDRLSGDRFGVRLFSQPAVTLQVGVEHSYERTLTFVVGECPLANFDVGELAGEFGAEFWEGFVCDMPTQWGHSWELPEEMAVIRSDIDAVGPTCQRKAEQESEMSVIRSYTASHSTRTFAVEAVDNVITSACQGISNVCDTTQPHQALPGLHSGERSLQSVCGRPDRSTALR